MDDFSLDRQELNGSLLSLEFGPGGRIQQLWATDPTSPEQSEEFQFVAPPMNMGEELTDDYFPGTVLIGARTHPDDPWIVSRNTNAEVLEEDEFGRSIAFQYEFAFLEELRATGRFYEIPGPVPQIAWDLRIVNRSRRSVEIGELGFPLALNNVYEGFPRTDKGLRELFNDRIYVHKFIGGSASYVFGQRMTARPPGLLIFPGGDTRWEFYHHVPASLHTPFRWEGIPVVYVHSRATVEREGWPDWFGEHTGTVLEPGEERLYQMRFAPAERVDQDGVSSTLSACGRPAMRLFPGAVAPVDVGIAVEVGGVTPNRFETDIEVELETDADEEGGFCFIKPETPGAARLTFTDAAGRNSDCQLLFTEPIERLIHRRAEWIQENQFYQGSDVLNDAIVPAENTTGKAITDPESFGSTFGVEASLADALFLAEKNSIYPVEGQIVALDRYLEGFFEDDLQNPGDGSVGSSFPDLRSVAVNTGRPIVYPLAFCLYQSMARIARIHGATARTSSEYLSRAARCATAMFRFAHPTLMLGAGIPLMSYLPSLIDDLNEAGFVDEAAELVHLQENRDKELCSRRYPFSGEAMWNTTAYEEVYAAASRQGADELLERTLRCAYAARSMAPSWWWHSSDKHWLDDQDGKAIPGSTDKGELCLGPTTVANSLMFFRTLDRDYANLPEATMRLAFGGMLSVWALVRDDGAASSGYCPDEASSHFGMSVVTGNVGIGLFHYLRGVGAYVLPTRTNGVTTFGCHFEIENEADQDWYVVRPWDGVGRKVIVRQLGLEIDAEGGVIRMIRFDPRKRTLQVSLENPSVKDHLAVLRVRGMWGGRFTVAGKELQSKDGELRFDVDIAAGTTQRIEVNVIG